VPPDADATVTMDVPTADAPVTDVPIDTATTDSAGDTAMPDGADGSATACGHTGEACCGTRYCVSGDECYANACRMYVRAANECNRPQDCAPGQACTGPTICGMHGCFQCVAPSGTAAFGAACVANTDCASGVCRGGKCTIACALGGTGNADCAAASSGYVCTELNYAVGATGMTSVVALGVCRRGCARNGDCAAPDVCEPSLNYASDQLDFICAQTSSTGVAGTTCVTGNDCQSLLCVAGGGPMGRAVCTAPCQTNADCPATASVCTDLVWLRPSGGTQPGRGCLPPA
jgi:hypothetical protein